MRAWLFQDHRQKQRLSEDKCPWSVGWIDPDGKRKSKRVGSKSNAEKFRRKVEGQLASGAYETHQRKSWAEFRQEYDSKISDKMDSGTRQAYEQALEHFQRLVKPQRIAAIKTQVIDDFVAKRRAERGRKKGSTVSPATVNKELRHLKAVFNIAVDWGYLSKTPKFRMLREPSKLPRYVTADHFAAIYGACQVATYPAGLPYSADKWWQAFLVFQAMTGWRMGEPLALRVEDVDLKAGHAITRHDDNKGRRDEMIPLHAVVIEHLRPIISSDPLIFPWYHSRELVWTQFHRIQEAAGIHLPCPDDHEHTPRCYVYGFHDLRRAFATLNAGSMTADALQKLMRHKSYTTTQRYINLADQLHQAVDNLHVPDVLRPKPTREEETN